LRFTCCITEFGRAPQSVLKNVNAGNAGGSRSCKVWKAYRGMTYVKISYADENSPKF
jgi:hypothetical protein